MACSVEHRSEIIDKYALIKQDSIDQDSIRISFLLEEYKQFISLNKEALSLPGLAYAIVRNGEVIAIETMGYRNINTRDSIDANTVFRLASVSKGFAAVLAAIFVDKSWLSWEDRLKNYMPYLRLKNQSNEQNVTIRHSLSHTTGLKQYAGSSWISKHMNLRQILKKLRLMPVEHPVGQVFSYQNAIYSSIAEISKVITGHSYEKMCDSLIFKPLKMNNASVGFDPEFNQKNVAYPHTYRKGRWIPHPVKDRWYNVQPAAGVNASITDMSKWLLALMGNREDVLNKKMLKELYTPQVPINADSDYFLTWAPGLEKAYYGLGWRIFDYFDKRIIYHGGFIRGFRPEIGFCPEENIGIVFLTNASRNELSSICIKTFFDLYFMPLYVDKMNE